MTAERGKRPLPPPASSGKTAVATAVRRGKEVVVGRGNKGGCGAVGGGDLRDRRTTGCGTRSSGLALASCETYSHSKHPVLGVTRYCIACEAWRGRLQADFEHHVGHILSSFIHLRITRGIEDLLVARNSPQVQKYNNTARRIHVYCP